MAGFEDIPNELVLEVIGQCHPRALLALITASPRAFRVFQRYHSDIIKALVKGLNAVPRPAEALAIAELRHLDCKPTLEYQHIVKDRFEDLLDISAGFIRRWPSSLPKLASLADIFDETDLLVERVREELVHQANDPRWSIGREPVPSRLGTEEHYLIQEGLLCYELHCRLFYHGDRGLAFSPRCRILFEDFRLHHPNFFPAIQFIYNIHWNNFLGGLTTDGPPGQCHATTPLLMSASQPEKHNFLRFLTSFGIQFVTKTSQCSPAQQNTILFAEFSRFIRLTGGVSNRSFPSRQLPMQPYPRRLFLKRPSPRLPSPCYRFPRYQFPQPDPRELRDVLASEGACEEEIYWYLHDDPRGLLESWPVFETRQNWYMGPWFKDWGTTIPWNEIRLYDRHQHHSVTNSHEQWMQNLFGVL